MRATLILFATLAIAAVQNDRVNVAEQTLRPGQTAKWAADHPSAIVYFTDGSIDGTNVKRGDVKFDEAARTVKNTGRFDVHYARIEFLGKGSAETWGSTGLSPNYKLLFENQYARVYDIRIPAGTKEPQHTHHDRVVVCLSGAQLKHLMPDGREEPSTLKTGEIAWRKGGTHIGQNLGKTDLWVIAVEPK